MNLISDIKEILCEFTKGNKIEKYLYLTKQTLILNARNQ